MPVISTIVVKERTIIEYRYDNVYKQILDDKGRNMQSQEASYPPHEAATLASDTTIVSINVIVSPFAPGRPEAAEQNRFLFALQDRGFVRSRDPIAVLGLSHVWCYSIPQQ